MKHMKAEANNIFTRPQTKWSLGAGMQGDIVISSRLRLARNLKNIPFPHRLNEAGQKEVLNAVSSAIPNLEKKTKRSYFYMTLAELTSLQRKMLVEKHLISPQFAQSRIDSALAIRQDEAVSIMVNEEDHLRIQCLLPAFSLEDAWKTANDVDDALAGKLEFAFDEQLGYLTACPTNLGTGLRASAMLHLPALVMSKKADSIFSSLPKLGLTVRGIYGEGTSAIGNLFQVSNEITLGRSEEDIIIHLQSVVMQLVEQERQARRIIQKEYDVLLYDNIWRAYGILSQARSLDAQEMMERLSLLRLGLDLGIFAGITHNKINELMIAGQDAFLQSANNGESNPQKLNWERAALVRKTLSETMEVK